MNEEFALELTKIQLLILAGGLSSLQIGFTPNIFVFTAGIAMITFGLVQSMVSLIDTPGEPVVFFRNTSIYCTIMGIVLAAIGIVFGMPVETGSEGPIDGIIMAVLVWAASVTILVMRFSSTVVWSYENKERPALGLGPFRKTGVYDALEIGLFYLLLLLSWFMGGMLQLAAWNVEL